MSLRKRKFAYRTAQSDTGGVLNDGPYRVKLTAFGGKLIYAEGDHKLTLPVEYGLDGSCNIGTALIRNWEGSPEKFDANQKFTIEKNIFAGLDYLHVRYSNSR